MALELPGGLVDAFYVIGLPWPGIDEDQLRAWATSVRSFADQVGDSSGQTHSAVAGLAASSQSSFTSALAEQWDDRNSMIVGLRGPIYDFAEALDVAADAVVVQKGAVIAAAAALAAEVVGTTIVAIATLGVGEAAVAGEVIAERLVVQAALRTLEFKLTTDLASAAVQAITDHVNRSVGNLAGEALPVAGEALMLKLSYQELDNAGRAIHGHATRTEKVAATAYTRNASRSLEGHGHGGRWPVLAIVETALRDAATVLFQTLPRAIVGAQERTAGALTRLSAELKEADSAASRDVPYIPARAAAPHPRAGTADAAASRLGDPPAGTSGLAAAGRAGGASDSVAGRPGVIDPIDAATGDVIVTQTDLTLPGVLPLLVERTHRSSWRTGRWFGRSWLSSLDQRLLITGDEVIGAFADGRVLTWTYPGGSGGPPVLPVTGPAWPLRRNRDGSYSVTDPQRGLTWRFERRAGYQADPGDQSELPLVSLSDRAGHEIVLSYDGAGQPSGISHSGGYRVRVTVTDGHVTGLTLAGRGDAGDQPLVSYAYDDDGNLAGVVNSSGQPLRYSYDTAGRLTGWTDRNGQYYRYAYDGDGRCVRGDGPDGTLSGTFSYEPGITHFTDAADAVTTYEITASAQVAAATDPLGNVTRWEHDSRGRVTTRVDPLGRVTRYAYDESGNLIAITRPDGSQATAEYDEQDQPIAVTGPDGSVWRQEFDRRGNRTRLIAPDGTVTELGYDDRGHLARVTGPDGAMTRAACDAAGLPVEVTGPDGSVTRYERDSMGRVTRVIAPDSGVTRLTWTTEGRPASRTHPDGATEDWSWDPEGNLARHVSPAGAATSYEYGPFDKVTAMRWPDGTRSEFRYDHQLQLTEVVHAGLTWRYDYDPAGRIVTETDYNGATTTYDYDAAGQLTRRVNAAGQETAFRYDTLANLTEGAAGGTVTTFGYDPLSRLVRARNADADIRLHRDALGRVIAETCNGRTVATEYDSMGRATGRVTPSGATTTWEYDLAGRPIAMAASGHQLRFGYDVAGQEIQRELPGGLVLTQDWDQRGRLTLQALAGPSDRRGLLPEGPALGELLARRAYSYHLDGLVTGIEDLLAGNRAIGLDAGGRVTAVTGSGWAEQYAYDPAGNVSAASWPAPSAGPGASWLDAEVQGRREVTGTLITRAGNIRYRHDRQGRVVQRQRSRISRKPDTWRYEWDADSRLTSVTTPDGSTWRYKYDPLGRRIAKEHVAADGTFIEQTVFTWNGAVLIEQALTTAAASRDQVVTWNHRPGTFTPLTQAEHASLRDAPQEQVNERFYAIVTDLVGTPTELIGADGTLAGHQVQTLWGGTTWTSDGAQIPLRFPGQYEDPETGLHYNNQRYYDPVSGSYLTPDPLGLVPAPNPHAYVRNPYVLIDPLGLAGCGSTSQGAVGPEVPWITANLPPAEELALNDTLSHIDKGTVSTGTTAVKWGDPFKNWGGDLPGGQGASSPHLEYRVAPPVGTSGAGPLRVVRNPQTGAMYYTWTHYGDLGDPAFVRIR